MPIKKLPLDPGSFFLSSLRSSPIKCYWTNTWLCLHCSMLLHMTTTILMSTEEFCVEGSLHWEGQNFVILLSSKVAALVSSVSAGTRFGVQGRLPICPEKQEVHTMEQRYPSGMASFLPPGPCPLHQSTPYVGCTHTQQHSHANAGTFTFILTV